jgi:hypothetical protein
MGRLFNIITRLKNRILDFRPKRTISLNENHKHIRMVKGFSGGAILLPKPITFNESIHNVFNENYLYPSEESYFIELKKARVFRHYFMFSIIDSKNNLLKEVSNDPLKREIHPVYMERINTKPKKLSGKTLMLATLGCDNVYYHWMMDLLPRLNVLTQNDINLNDFDFIIINPIIYAYQKESLNYLKIKEDKLIFLNENSHFICENLIVPSIQNHHPSSLKFLRKSFMDESINFPTKRIYISRENSEWRNIENQEAFLSLLNNYGFMVAKLEDLSLLEQIKLFSNSQIIIGTHGAGLTNIIFCNPNSTVMEITAKWNKNVDYWISACFSQLHYHLIESETNPKLEDLNNNNNSQEYNSIVNLNILKSHIEQAIKRYEIK